MIDFQQVKARIPYFLKVPYRSAIAMVPYTWRNGGKIYRDTYKFLQKSQWFSKNQLVEYQNSQLKKLVLHCYQNVPYYSRIFADYGLNPKDINEPNDLRKLPFLDKETIITNFLQLTAINIPKRVWRYCSTGGTSGKPLLFYADKQNTVEREQAFWSVFLDRVDYSFGDKMVVLRNNALLGKKKWDYSPLTRKLVLDPFKLTPTNVDDYFDAIAQSGIKFLHTYPSAATTLLHFAKEARKNRELPIRTIVATSENVYNGQRFFLENGFNARFFSQYGHSERLIFAGECEHSINYHVFPEYGVLELIDEHGKTITKPGIVGEIVGTGFNNYVMPMLRYRTGDFAEYSEEHTCKCGRNYPLLSRVKGRWLQEMIIRGDGAYISITALNMHSNIFDNVRQFQFYQDTPGELNINVIRAENYSEIDTIRIRKQLLEKLGDIQLDINFVDSIPATSRGKHKFLIQKLNVAFGENK